jgi:hypothetical protein
MKVKIRVFTEQDVECGYNGTELINLHPRRYMTSYSFDRLMKYAKEELYWANIKQEDVVGFEIYCRREHWTQYISREEAK